MKEDRLSVTSEDTEKSYRDALKKLTASTEDAIAVSHACANLNAGDRGYWASVLMTRMSTFAVTVLSLCPSSKLNPIGIHWDFGSVASITRNIYELSLTFHYLSTEKVSDDEWLTRLRVMQLHDCMSRYRMFKDWGSADDELNGFETQANDLRAELTKLQFFTGLDAKLKAKLLRGETPSILIQDEILTRMGVAPQQVRGYYRLLSAHTHSFPMGYYRMTEHGYGHGEENVLEKNYIAIAADFAAECLERSTKGMKELFEPHVDLTNLAPYNLSFILQKAIKLANEKKRRRKFK
ncbi:MAG: DUF5677 domain-containing protein [Candidatus Obscuribacter sp.]|nr:DUF5677 domain-containing protein [Candidatus Obscuribacter sp.]